MWKRILLVIFILFCIELGLFLVILPWSRFWDRNIFVAWLPGLRATLLSYYFRGAISGMGVVNVWVGASDAWHFRRNLELLEKEERRLLGSRSLAEPAGIAKSDPPG